MSVAEADASTRGVSVAAYAGRGDSVREVGLLALVPLLVACVMLWPALSGRGVLASTDLLASDPLTGNPAVPAPPSANPMLGDPVDQFIPWRLYARSELLAGRFPLWNPYNALGSHFHANYQSGTLSPFNLLWLLLPPMWGLGAIIALKWAILGFGMGLLLRKLGMSLPAALFGSVAAQLMGPAVGWLQWPHTEALAWLPWLLFLSLGWVETRRPLWLAAFALAVAAEMLAGHIETAFYSVTLTVAFVLAALGALALPFRQKVGALLGLGGAGVLGVGIAAAQVLPLLGVITTTWQWVSRQLSPVNLVAAQPLAALTLLSPNGFGWADAYHGPFNWIEIGGYVGALTLLLAGWGAGLWLLSLRRVSLRSGPVWKRLLVALSPRRPLFWLLVVVVAASMTYGIPPLSSLRRLPGFNSSLNYRLISLADIGLIMLGAMSLQRLIEWRARLQPRLLLPLAALLGGACLFFLMGGVQVWMVSSQDVAAYTGAWKMWAGALFCAGALLMLLRLAGLLKPGAWAWLAVTLLLLDMGRAGWNFNSISPASTFYPSNALTDFLARHGPTERVAINGFYAETDRLMPYRVPDLRYYDPAMDNRARVYVHILSPTTYGTHPADYPIHMLLDTPKPALMSLVGVKWLVTASTIDPNSWQPAPASGPIYKPAFSYNGLSVWENLYARPYAYFAPSLKPVSGEGVARQSMKELTMGKLEAVIVEDPGKTLPANVLAPSTTPMQAGSVRFEHNIPGRIEVSVTVGQPRFLVINEAWSEGWRAEVDGTMATLYRASYVAQGLVVPAGSHTVVLTYDPPFFRAGVLTSLASLLAWAALLIIALRSRRKTTPTGP